jgi:phage-related protein
MADFELPSGYDFEEIPKFNTLISSFENGAEQRRAKRSGAITEYKLVYKNISQADMDIITTLYNTSKGALSSFTWLHPISAETLTVRFKEDSLSFVCTSYGIYQCEFNIVTIA